MGKSLEYFMRPESMTEQTITVPGPKSIVDENGQVVNLEIKMLSNAEVEKIQEMYHTHVPAKDKNGNYIINNNVLVYRDEKDTNRAARHIMVEALVYPNLKDPDLMDYYKCQDVTDMPFKVFPRADEYSYVSKQILKALGMGDKDEDEKAKKDLKEAKNS